MDKKSEKLEEKPAENKPKRDLLEEQDSIANLRKYHMSIQNVKISAEMRKFFSKPPNS